MTLSEYLKKELELPEPKANLIDSLFAWQTLPKGTQLLGFDNQSNKVFFIEQGLARAYYIKDDKDITHQFFPENHIYLPVESVYYNKVSPYAFELLENSVIRSINYNTIEQYLKKDIDLQITINRVLIDVVNSLANKLFSIQFQSAQERYTAMIKSYPNICLRAPLGHIASYLGITQQTLSVIRAEKTK